MWQLIVIGFKGLSGVVGCSDMCWFVQSWKVGHSVQLPAGLSTVRISNTKNCKQISAHYLHTTRHVLQVKWIQKWLDAKNVKIDTEAILIQNM